MNFEYMRLGKKEYEHDSRTLMVTPFLAPEIIAPPKFDFDKGRAAFPRHMWGNDQYGDCVFAGRAKHLLSLERIEQRRNIPLYDTDVINLYKALTGCQSPGDPHDTGYVILYAMRDWRNNGWTTPYANRNFKIAAYGELEPKDGDQLRRAVYALSGIHMGLWLPRAAQHMGNVWDYNGETTPEFKPGSWGGHLVYCKAYDKTGIKALTWGEEITLTNSFVDKYCDEAWAVVDNFDSWRVKQTIDVEALQRKLQSITNQVNQ